MFLLTFAGGLAGLYSLRPEWVTVTGMQERLRRLDFGTIAMAVVAWLTCITGSFIVYTWYRAAPPDGTTGDALRAFPRYFLLANEGLKEWHAFGMEWKEHVAWFAPLLATAVAYIVWRYRGQLAGNAALRNIVIWRLPAGLCCSSRRRPDGRPDYQGCADFVTAGNQHDEILENSKEILI